MEGRHSRLKNLKRLISKNDQDQHRLDILLQTPGLEWLDLKYCLQEDRGVIGNIINVLPQLENLKGLDIGDNSLQEDGHVFVGILPKLVNLETFCTQNNFMGGDHTRMLIQSLGSLPNLRHLDLSYNVVGDDAARLLGQLPQLETINLENTQISRDGVIDLLSTNNNIKCLNLKKNKNLGWGEEDDPLQQLTNLQELRLDYYPHSFLSLGPNGLRVLSLGQLGTQHIHQLSMVLPRLSSTLRVLGLDNANLSGLRTCQELMTGLLSLTQIQELALEHSTISGVFANQLANTLPPLQALQKIHLLDMPLHDEGMVQIVRGIATNTNLVELSFFDVGMGDQAAKELSIVLPKLQKLRCLDLPFNLIGNEGMGYIANTAHHLSNLEFIDLNQNRYDEQGAKELITSFTPLLEQNLKSCFLLSSSKIDLVHPSE